MMHIFINMCASVGWVHDPRNVHNILIKSLLLFNLSLSYHKLKLDFLRDSLTECFTQTEFIIIVKEVIDLNVIFNI